MKEDFRSVKKQGLSRTQRNLSSPSTILLSQCAATLTKAREGRELRLLLIQKLFHLRVHGKHLEESALCGKHALEDSAGVIGLLVGESFLLDGTLRSASRASRAEEDILSVDARSRRPAVRPR